MIMFLIQMDNVGGDNDDWHEYVISLSKKSCPIKENYCLSSW